MRYMHHNLKQHYIHSTVYISILCVCLYICVYTAIYLSILQIDSLTVKIKQCVDESNQGLVDLVIWGMYKNCLILNFDNLIN